MKHKLYLAVAATLVLFGFSAVGCTGSSSGPTSAGGSDDSSNVPVPVPGMKITFSAVAPTSMKVTWDASSDSITPPERLQYRLLMSTSDNMSTLAMAEANGTEVLAYTANLLVTTVTGLEPSKKYYFVVIAKNEAGGKALYNTKSQTTGAGNQVESPAFSLVEGTFNTSQNVTITVATSGADICYTTNGTLPAASPTGTCSGGSIQIADGGVVSITSTTTLKALGTKAGMINSSATIRTYTIDTVAPTPGTSITFSAISTTGMTVQWGKANDAVTLQKDLMYTLLSSTSGNISTIVDAETNGTEVLAYTANQLTAPVTGLSPSTPYYFAVIVKDGVGNKALYAMQSQATQAVGTVDSPILNPLGGSYNTDQNVTISSDTSEAVICYTTNGTSPAASTPGICSVGTQIANGGAVPTITSTTTLKALATKAEFINSGITTQTYTLDKVAPAEVTGRTQTNYLQSSTLNWTNPSDADFTKTKVYYKCYAGETACTITAYTLGCEGTQAASTVDTCSVTGLMPYKKYDYIIKTTDTLGNESAGVVQSQVQTVFTGTAADFNDDQKIEGKGGTYYFTWNDTHFFAAISNGGANLLNTNDALWVAFDTDNSASGEIACDTFTNTKVHWPFKANYVAELKVTGAGATQTKLKDVGGAGWAALTATAYEGALDEFSFEKTTIGTPTQARIAMIAVNTSNGNTYSLLPDNSAAATDTTGSLASLTSFYNLGTKIFDPTYAAASASGAAKGNASFLVQLSLSHVIGKTVKIKGSLAPLSYTLTDSNYSLLNNFGDNTVYLGSFNFAGVNNELFFKFNDGTDEPKFTALKDRVYTLSGSNETIPSLTWDTVYSAGNSFTLNWMLNSCPSADTGIRGSALPLEWANTNTLLTLDTGTCAGSTSFSNTDLVTTPLEFKGFYKDNNPAPDTEHYENDCATGLNNNRSLNDDVINRRTVTFTWNDGSQCNW